MTKETEPDCGGNRPYDYISCEAFDAAEKTIGDKRQFSELTQDEIVVLRHQLKWNCGLNKDVVDVIDRLALIRCLFYHAENRDAWYKKASELGAQLEAAEARAERYKKALEISRAIFDDVNNASICIGLNLCHVDGNCAHCFTHSGFRECCQALNENTQEGKVGGEEK